MQIERSLEKGMLHEAQACTIVEALGALGYLGRSGTLVTKLLDRLSALTALLPHSAVALLHGLALLHVEPPPPVTVADILKLMEASALPIDLAEMSTLLWSLVELGCAEAAMEAVRTLPPETIEMTVTADLHTLTTCLWSLLTLRCYDHALIAHVITALTKAAGGIHQVACARTSPPARAASHPRRAHVLHRSAVRLPTCACSRARRSPISAGSRSARSCYSSRCRRSAASRCPRASAAGPSMRGSRCRRSPCSPSGLAALPARSREPAA